MKKCIVVCSLGLLSSALSFGFDPFNDHLYEFGYQYNSESPWGFYVGCFGFFVAFNLPDIIFDDSESSENGSPVDASLSQVTLGYSFKLTNWLYLPIGVALWNDVVDTDSNSVPMDKYGFTIGLEFDLNIINGLSYQFKVSTLNFDKLLFGVGMAFKRELFSGDSGNRSDNNGGGSSSGSGNGGGGNGGNGGSGGGGGGNNGGGSGRRDGGRDYFSYTP
ncbi:MAG: hypothetical protein MdMp014T_2888 [Treponematales bacterium]